MRNTFKTYVLLAVILISATAQAQSFRKGSLLVSISEGATFTNYNTSASSDVIHHVSFSGNRDPLCLEYGITKRLGVGLTSGADILMVDPAMYRYDGSVHHAKTIMGEFTIDATYHLYVTKRYDISAYFSFGGSSLNIKGVDGEGAYQYTAKGGIVRVGSKARYYVGKRFALMGILSAYSAKFDPNSTVSNTFGNGFSTKISGFAAEFGLSYRILR